VVRVVVGQLTVVVFWAMLVWRRDSMGRSGRTEKMDGDILAEYGIDQGGEKMSEKSRFPKL